MISKDLLGCSTARNKGTCDNRLNIRRDALEASILNGLRKHLMEPELFKEFCAEFTREVNRLRIERGADLEGWKRELDKIGRQISQIINAITDGMYHPSMKEKMTGLEARKAELEEKFVNADEPPPLMHPNMTGLYSQRIGQLYEHLQDEDSRPQAAETFRSLVDQVTLVPDNGELTIVLSGDLGAILRFATGKKNPDFLTEAKALDNLLSPGSLVAGTRSRRPLRNGSEQQKTSSAGALEVSQVSLVAGAGCHRNLPELRCAV